jgi:DNA helicase-2/ATP-dependent DNA helicase PcrA
MWEESPALAGLSPRQREAVLAVEGPVLVLAGAGSGKTKVITHRIAHLVRDRGVAEEAVLAVTFTNKAAEEMRSRAAVLLGKGPGDRLRCWVSTFHSFGVRVLRRDGVRIGLAREFVIFDEHDQLALVRGLLRDLGVSEQQVPPRRALAADDDRFDFHPLRPMARIADEYEKRLGAAGALDFDDLLLKTVALFRECPDVCGRYRNALPYMLVDEYQDTNRTQYELIRLLAGPQGNLTAVGDEDQSIYSWRGADIGNILSFETDFPKTRTIRLEDNYRSTQAILDVAGALVAHNRRRKGKTLRALRAAGEPVTVYAADDEFSEAAWVTARAAAARGAGRVAVLYRMNAQSRLIEEGLLRMGVPYVVVGGLAFYERKEIKDLLAYLRLLVNPRDLVSFRRIANVPARGLGENTVEAVTQLARARSLTVWEALAAVGGERLVPARAVAALERFATLMADLGGAVASLGVRKTIEKVVAVSGYASLLAQEGPGARDRLENVEELLSAADEYECQDVGASLASFLDRVALLTSSDQRASTGAISLMTLHAAKGLEFEAVFLLGLEEGVLPHARSLDTSDALEEERRLCYVGMTRARDRLYLSRAETRQVFGRRTTCLPSRFLMELPQDVLKQEGARARQPWRPVVRTRETVRHEEEACRPGVRVRHAQFGEGTILRVDGAGADVRATVSFPGAGTRRLLVRLAGLEIL